MLSTCMSHRFPAVIAQVLGQIIAIDMRVPLVKALVFGNLGEYRHKSHIAEN